VRASFGFWGGKEAKRKVRWERDLMLGCHQGVKRSTQPKEESAYCGGCNTAKAHAFAVVTRSEGKGGNLRGRHLKDRMAG